MLAKETGKPFNDKEWLFEIKWDGYRAISEITKDKVELYSRNGNSFNTSYPIVLNELKKIKQQVVLDGEIVVLNEKGRSDFQKLQHYDEATQEPLCYYIFDLLAVNGKNIYDLPLIERKKLLKSLIKKNDVIKYSDHVLENGTAFFKAAKQQDLEGIMAKKTDSQYYPGVRTANWLKVKYHKSEDVIIVGFTAPGGARKYFGALVLALKTKTGFKYVGHTGSGFNEKLLKEVYNMLVPLIKKDSPFKEVIKTNAPVTWVQPKYICEIKFTEWTNDGSMRHPIFLRIRNDKSLKDM